MKESFTPKQWHKTEIILLYNKGDRSHLNNYRPVSLLSNISKVFFKLIKSRIYSILDIQQPINQAGFRRGYSTIDHIFTINQVLEKSREFNFPLHIMFIDLLIIIKPSMALSIVKYGKL